VGADESFGQAARLGAEDNTVVRFEIPFPIRHVGFGRKKNEPRSRESSKEGIDVDVAVEHYILPIVESGTSELTVVHSEACYSDNVKRRISGSAQTGDVAGIRRDLGLVKGDVHRH
jgi:hypothetical protein